MQKGIKAKGTDDRMPAGAEDEFTGFLGRTVARASVVGKSTDRVSRGPICSAHMRH